MSNERNLMTGLKFWFWLLLFSIPIGAVAAVMWWVSNQRDLAGVPIAGAWIIVVALGVGLFVFVLWVYGWIIHNKINRR